ncbi:M48 family metalloprotease, partial [Candidatus Babeliales bacterium]|nr:M48 family metalloprotease [Candidatus Babeliales bacterium]
MNKFRTSFLSLTIFSLFLSSMYHVAYAADQQKTSEHSFSSVTGSVVRSLDCFYPAVGLAIPAILLVALIKQSSQVRKEEKRALLTDEQKKLYQPVLEKILGEDGAKKIVLMSGGTSDAPGYTGLTRKRAYTLEGEGDGQNFSHEIVLNFDYFSKNLGLSPEALKFIVGHEAMHIKNKDLKWTLPALLAAPMIAHALFEGGIYLWPKPAPFDLHEKKRNWLALLISLGAKSLSSALLISAFFQRREKQADIGSARALGTAKGGIESFEKWKKDEERFSPANHEKFMRESRARRRAMERINAKKGVVLTAKDKEEAREREIKKYGKSMDDMNDEEFMRACDEFAKELELRAKNRTPEEIEKQKKFDEEF